MKLSYPVRLRLLCPAVFLSGAAALVYEIVWTRYLSLRMGSTTGAAAAVLSAFMLGLALGLSRCPLGCLVGAQTAAFVLLAAATAAWVVAFRAG